MSGKFIVFEGIDNSGKTTVSEKISEWLESEHGITSVLTRHPGSTPIGQEIRGILKHSPHPINANAQALLFAADNSIFMNQVLKPNLDQGNWVIGDRNNFLSSLAYQIASGCSFDELDDVHKATRQVAKIDLLLIFTCDYEESQRRRALKNEEGRDRFEDAGREYFDKLAKCYNNVLETQHERLQKFVNKRDLPPFLGYQPNAYYVDAMKPLDEVIDTVKGLIQESLQLQADR
jgi:dTMP kinase